MHWLFPFIFNACGWGRTIFQLVVAFPIYQSFWKLREGAVQGFSENFRKLTDKSSITGFSNAVGLRTTKAEYIFSNLFKMFVHLFRLFD